MEMMTIKGDAKGQLMSIAALVFVLLMVLSLSVLVTVGIGYDSISQSAITSSSSTNYGMLLKQSASTFAYGSASAALNTLFKYEYNASLRKTNLISNFSQYMQYLIVNGSLPNVALGSATANILQKMMGNATLASYNSIISSVTGTGSKNIKVSETKPSVYQTNPYSIEVQYNEYVSINTSSGVFSYTIPVNVSIPINNTPDLFYAQQGVYRLVKPGSLNNLVTIVGNSYGSAGDPTRYIYGTVYALPYSSTCSSIPSPLNSNPYASQLIIVDSNAPAINNCAMYGGFITDNAVSSPPVIPYLVVSSSTFNLLQTGQRVLLYGPSLAVLNVTNLINNVSSGSYFASPFASSFSQRASGNVHQQSPSGIFTLSGIANRQAAFFNGQTSFITIPYSPLFTFSSLTISAWVSPTNVMSGYTDEGIVAQNGATENYELALEQGPSYPPYRSPHGFVVTSGGEQWVGSGITANLNNWYHLVLTFNGTTQIESIYVNGVLKGSVSTGGAIQNTPDNVIIGERNINVRLFTGLISNVQIYNTSLSSTQVSQLYQQGVEGLPVAGANVVGWWPLNGNSNDYSGKGNNGVANQITYVQIPYYTSDSAVPNSSASVTPIPGLSNCNTMGQCASSLLSHIYLSNQPLSIGNSGTTTAYFGQSSGCVGNGYVPIVVSQLNPNSLSALTISWWENYQSGGVEIHLDSSQSSPGGSGVYCGYNSCPVPTSSIANAPSGITISANNWYFMTLTLTPSGTATLYTDGQAGTATTWNSVAGLTGITDFDILGYSNGCSDWSAGPISDVQLYNTALSSAQVNQLYNKGITGTPVLASNVIGWWPLNGNTNDYSGNGNNGASNSISYQYISVPNAGGAATANTIIASQLSDGSVNSGWQALGFGAPPYPQVSWNVTAWLLANTVSYLPYATVSANPLNTGNGWGATYQGADLWYGGPFNGVQQWSYGNGAYIGDTYLNMLTTPFPSPVGDLNNIVSCGSPYDTEAYAANATMYLSGTYTFEDVVDDQMEVFTEPVGGASWTAMFPGGGSASGVSWPNGGQGATQYTATSPSFSPGLYNVVVDWTNICSSGVGSLHMS